jgi:integrase/recombinase XerD
VFESLLTVPLALDRHRSAPYRAERESFLEQQRKQGASNHNLLQIASRLIYVVRYLNIGRTEGVGFDEIKRAARRWIKHRDAETERATKRSSIYSFTGLARRFLKFHGKLVERPKPPQPFSDKLEQFVDFLVVEKSLRPQTVHGQRWHISQFLRWYATRHKSLSASSLKDIDNYLMGQTEKWSGWTVREAAHVLRGFFRYARTKCWCRRLLAEAIKGPHIRKDATPGGPSWIDVQRLLRQERQDTAASMRVQVLLLLFALYGLRTSEATGLLLNNLDWKSKSFTVRRAKNYTLQRFPFFPRFESTVRRYLKLGRPNCQCKYLVVTLRPPYRPLNSGSVAGIIKSRMLRLGIKSVHKGPQSLRHACATRLLKKDMSLQEIADFLGHRDCLTVGVYAKHDLDALRRVAAVDLCGGL